MQNQAKTPDSLPSTEQLLIAGGDARIALNPFSGLNKYGCQPFPDPQLLAFGSSTASVISTEGFSVANRLRQKLLTTLSTESHIDVYALEMQRIRLEWRQLCELSDLIGLELIFAPSGTDIHTIAAQYTGSGVSTPALIIMVEANETGSGVASALADNSFNIDKQGRNGNSTIDSNTVEVVQVSIRLDDGTPRPSAEIDAEVENLVNKAVASDRRVLLILVDQSKTGLIAPSPACVIALHRRFPDNIEVLVDACQFRIAMPTLLAHLKQGFMVALTGSKFLTAPSFSAALLLPSTIAERLQKRAFPRSLLTCSSRANWPTNWTGVEHLDHAANFGLLLRSEVALEELRRFRAVPQTVVIDFLLAFAEAIQQRLTSDPHFEPLPVPQLDRRPLIEANSWDHLQTIFPFLLYDPQPAGRIPLSREQTLHVYQQLPITVDHPDSNVVTVHRYAAPGNRSVRCSTTPILGVVPPDPTSMDGGNTARLPGAVAAMQSLIRCQLGQPVACGARNGIAVSALRLCISSRLIVEATAHDDKGNAIIKDALTALDKTVLLIQSSGREQPI